jgi:hypothetical protein
MRPYGGAHPDQSEEAGVERTLRMFAEDVGLAYSTVRGYRWTSAKWPTERRVGGVSHEVHRILASAADPFEVIGNPPVNPRTGRRQWFPDAAKRVVGWKTDTPETVQEKVEAIHDLARDGAVAARVTTDFLRRPDVAEQVPPREKVRVVEELTRDDHVATEVTQNLLRRPDVAFQAMGDGVARQMVNKAQFERTMEAEDFTREQVPLIAQVERSMEFMDLIGSCHVFVAAAGRLVPSLGGHTFSAEEREVVARNLAKVRATCEWIATAVTTGRVDLDEELAALLRGE